MHVPETMLRCVDFLYALIGGEMCPMGTAFWLAQPIPAFPEKNVSVFLTANHVIKGCRTDSDDGKVYIRVNTRSGVKFIETDAAEWVAPEPSVDVAMFTNTDLIVGDSEVEFGAWRATNIATDEIMRAEGIGIGDEVFMVGLFHVHTGQDRNEPIIRVGNIAALPSAPIPSPDGPMHAILIEARSIGGLSGSPVFVHMGFARWRDGEMYKSGTAAPFFFLGLIHGHWNIGQEQIDVVTDARGENLHTGIAVVVPAEQIAQHVLSIVEEAVQMKTENLNKEQCPTQDSAAVPTDPTADLLVNLEQVPKEEADEVHRRHQT
jgi:hypothetical protein